MSNFQHFELFVDSDTTVKVRLEFHEKWKLRGTSKTYNLAKYFGVGFFQKYFQ